MARTGLSILKEWLSTEFPVCADNIHKCFRPYQCLQLILSDIDACDFNHLCELIDAAIDEAGCEVAHEAAFEAELASADHPSHHQEMK